MLQVQSSPLIWSTNVRSTRLYGQFLAGPNHRTLILISNPDIRSARLYGKFSLDKTLTSQAGSTVRHTVVAKILFIPVCYISSRRWVNQGLILRNVSGVDSRGLFSESEMAVRARTERVLLCHAEWLPFLPATIVALQRVFQYRHFSVRRGFSKSTQTFSNGMTHATEVSNLVIQQSVTR